MFQLVADFLRTQGWVDWSLAQIETDSLVWWIFPPGASTPTFIGKLPRTALDTRIARREAGALESLAPYACQLNVPRLVFQSDTHDGRFVFVQTGLLGRPLAEQTESLAGVLAWLEQFQSSVPAQATMADASSEAVQFCRNQLPELSPAENQLLLALEAARPDLALLPATAVHGDFWTGNILEKNGRLAVVDWSNFHFGSPLEDLHNFAAAQGYSSRGSLEEQMQSMWRVFFSGSPLAGRTRDGSLRLLESRGMTPGVLQPLFLLFLTRRIACIEFSNHAAWRRFAEHYVAKGMPEPFRG